MFANPYGIRRLYVFGKVMFTMFTTHTHTVFAENGHNGTDFRFESLVGSNGLLTDVSQYGASRSKSTTAE